MHPTHLGQIQLLVSPLTGGDFVSSLTPRRAAARIARGLLCIPFICFAAAPASADSTPQGAFRIAQTDDQPAEASPPAEAPASHRTTKPAPKPARAERAKAKPPAQPAPAAPPAAPAQPAPVAQPAAPAQPAPPAPEPAAAAEPQPLAHAAQAGVKACLDGLVRTANATVDTQHTAMSQWYNGAVNSHVFESIVSLSYPNKVAPRAVVMLLGAPTQSQGCDTSYVQVFPTARGCAAIQGDLLKDGKVVANLSGVAVTESSTGARQLLLPAPGNGCVIVVIGLTFGK
jgi:hypothetical protein